MYILLTYCAEILADDFSYDPLVLSINIHIGSPYSHRIDGVVCAGDVLVGSLN